MDGSSDDTGDGNGGDATNGTDASTGAVDDDERRKLETVREYLEHLRETTPYYRWLDPDVLAVERGFVRIRQPYAERTEPPAVGPNEGINGGVLVTLADAAGMAAVIADALEPIPLATTDVTMSFHDGATEPHVVEAETISVGSTLATARIEVVPESDLGTDDRRVLASGETTARLFER